MFNNKQAKEDFGKMLIEEVGTKYASESWSFKHNIL
jgi:hypothetical protein